MQLSCKEQISASKGRKTSPDGKATRIVPKIHACTPDHQGEVASVQMPLRRLARKPGKISKN
jgi:hypothetical protein